MPGMFCRGQCWMGGSYRYKGFPHGHPPPGGAEPRPYCAMILGYA